MSAREIKKDIYWVGAVDWDLRNFHGYITPRGTSYNAYLIIDKKITVVDTVKNYCFEEMLANIKEIIDPAEIDYLVINHVEMDHAGSIPELAKAAPRAKIVTSAKGQKGLERYFRNTWDYRLVKSGDSLSLGRYTLNFVHTPMVHWPDSMATYVPEAKLLLPNDAFGQHIASYQRFDDEVGWEIIHEEAAKYYANIVLPYGRQVLKALEALGGLDIDMVAPSHGLIWRTFLPRILEVYPKWAGHETEKKALIVYDTMWGSTKNIALQLKTGLESAGMPVTLRSLQTSHISEIVADMLTSKAVLIGSPTLNNGMLPSIGAFLTYIRGLRPEKRIGLAFGSYGWGGQGVKETAAVMEQLGWEMPLEHININYAPDPGEDDQTRETGAKLARIILE